LPNVGDGKEHGAAFAGQDNESQEKWIVLFRALVVVDCFR